MSIRTVLLCLALGASAIAAPVFSHAGVNLDIDIAPPGPREERVPPPREGYVWAPGYWGWSDHRHEWYPGHWERERHGEHWVAAHWEQRGPHWHFEEGHWEH